MKKMLIVAAVAMAATTASFGAVKANQFGVDYMYSGGVNSFGAWWHVSDKIALRPTVGFKYTDQDNAGTQTTTTMFTLGVAVPIYIANFSALDLYVAPAFAYTSNGSKSTTGGVSVSTSSSSISASAALGMQVKLVEQVSIFGEMGIGYDKDDSTKKSTIQTARTAVGAIFYFN